MKMFLASLALMISLSSLGNGEENRLVTILSGNVLESGTSEQLTGVKVSVLGTDIFTYTDRYGFYELPNVPLGPVVLEFSLVSFEPSKLEIDLNKTQMPVVNAALEAR